ncbi:hypothetical protein [Persephonella sp.]
MLHENFKNLFNNSLFKRKNLFNTPIEKGRVQSAKIPTLQPGPQSPYFPLQKNFTPAMGPIQRTQAGLPKIANTEAKTETKVTPKVAPKVIPKSIQTEEVQQTHKIVQQDNQQNALQNAGIQKLVQGVQQQGVQQVAQPQQPNQIDILRQRLIGTLEMTPEEKNLAQQEAEIAKQLADLSAQTRISVMGLEGQGRAIPINILRGQQQNLLEQSSLRALPLKAQLASIQAQRELLANERQRQAEAIGMDIGFEQQSELARQQQAQAQSELINQEREKIIEIAQNAIKGGASQNEVLNILNSGTSEQALALASPYLQEKPERKLTTLSPGQILVDENGNIVAQGGKRPPTQAEIERALAKEEADKQARQAQSTLVGIVNDILSKEDLLRRASGTVGRFFAGKFGTQSVRNKMLTLKSLLTIENLDKIKGALSDKDMEIIQQAGSVLSPAIQEDGSINLQDEEVVQELKNLRGLFKLKLKGNADVIVTDSRTLKSYELPNATPEEVEKYQLDNYLIDFK